MSIIVTTMCALLVVQYAVEYLGYLSSNARAYFLLTLPGRNAENEC